MAGLQTLDKGNPEALHDIGQSKAPMVGEKFVNPGTPEAALVSYDQLTQAKSVVTGLRLCVPTSSSNEKIQRT